MQSMDYVGLDVHKKTISCCVKDVGVPETRPPALAPSLHAEQAGLCSCLEPTRTAGR